MPGHLAYLCRQKPDLVVIEDIFSLGKYPASGITLGKVTGVLLLAAGRAGSPVVEIQVREAKKVVTGSGAADKYQVERSVRHLLSHEGVHPAFPCIGCPGPGPGGFFPERDLDLIKVGF